MTITSLNAMHGDTKRVTDMGLPFALDIVSRYTTHLAAGTTDSHPDGPRFIPAGEYLDIDIHRSDIAMMRRTPMVIAHSSELPNPLSFSTEELLGVPVLLVRQKSGEVKAFLNSCLHRGAKLCDGSGDLGARIVCPYHSWNYHPDGRLGAVNQAEKFGEFEKGGRSLVAIPCSEQHGLIFVTLDREGITDVDAFLGDFSEILAQANLDQLVMHGRWLEPQPMNWKIALSTYYESYHVKTVHSATIAPMFVGNLSTHNAFGPDSQHMVTTWAAQGVNEFSGLTDDVIRKRLAEEVPPYIKVLFLFPNVVITGDDATQNFSHLIRVTPGDGPGEQLTDVRMVKRPNLPPETQSFLEEFAKVTLYALEEEDYATVSHIAKALSTGLQSGVHFGANEITLTEIHRKWAKAAGRADPDQPVTA